MSYRCTCTATKHRAQIKSLQAGPIVLITEPAMCERPTAKRFRWRPGRARYCRRKESITVLLSGSTGLFCHCHMLYRRILTDCLSPAYKSQQQMTVSNIQAAAKHTRSRPISLCCTDLAVYCWTSSCRALAASRRRRQRGRRAIVAVHARIKRHQACTRYLELPSAWTQQQQRQEHQSVRLRLVAASS
jgi:hypothetical protein